MSDFERQRPAWMIAISHIGAMSLTGELDDDDEIVDIFSNDITSWIKGGARGCPGSRGS